MISTGIIIEGKEYQLRYENKQQRDIKQNAPKLLFPEAKGLKFASPMDILNYLNDLDVQIYMLQKGLEWPGSGYDKIDNDKAADLRQLYLEAGEPDSGEKLEAFQELLAEALALNVVGASGKKLREKGEKLQQEMKDSEKKKKVEELAIIYEAKMLAEQNLQKRKELSGTNGNKET